MPANKVSINATISVQNVRSRANSGDQAPKNDDPRPPSVIRDRVEPVARLAMFGMPPKS
jgi:hypothetical protein